MAKTRYEVKRTKVGGQSAVERRLDQHAFPFVIVEVGKHTKTVLAVPTHGMGPVHNEARKFAEKVAAMLEEPT